MRKLITLFVILWALQSASGQQDPMFTKYVFNPLSYNPAYAGSKGFLTMDLLYRNQWWGIDGAPESQTLTGHSPISKNIGLGLSFVNDKIGATGSTNANLAYAYMVKLGSGSLNLGLQASILNWRANWNELDYRDNRSLDYIFDKDKISKWLPNFGAGVYYHNASFYLGASVPRLIEMEVRDRIGGDDDSTPISKIYRHLYISAGAAFPIGADMVFRPSLLLKNTGWLGSYASSDQDNTNIGAPTEFDIDLSVLFMRTLWLGASFRSSVEKLTADKSSFDSVDFWASFMFKNGLRLGAAYDYTLTELNKTAGGSFELMLGYDFNYEVKNMSTPRYF